MNRREEARLLRHCRREAWRRQGGRCLWCGVHMLKNVAEARDKPLQALTGDHLIPESEGGPTTIENIVGACRRCNQRRSNRSVEQWVKFLEKDMHPQQFALLLQRIAKSGISLSIGQPAHAAPTVANPIVRAPEEEPPAPQG